MSNIQQPLNKTAFIRALDGRNISQAVLAQKIGANEKSFSRWINDGYIQSQYLWDLTEELDLSDEELDEILMLPKYKVFFRKKYLGEVPDEVEQRAIDFAKTLFGLTYLNSNARFCPPNVSKLESDTEVANQIRRYTKIDSFRNLPGIISGLAEQGVEVTVVPFEKLGLTSNGEHEQAFSVTDEKRCLIFLDASSPKERLIFNLCHELCHLFRPDLEFSSREEKFCNAVASELVYPKSFFEAHRETIEKIVQSNSGQSIVNLLNVIKENLGGEIFGISLRLKALGFFSQKNLLHQKIISYSEDSFNRLPLFEIHVFSDFNPRSHEAFSRFWGGPQIESSNFLRFFFHIKNAAIGGAISSRKFSELFNVDIGLADEIFHKWKMDLQNDLNVSNG